MLTRISEIEVNTFEGEVEALTNQTLQKSPSHEFFQMRMEPKHISQINPIAEVDTPNLTSVANSIQGDAPKYEKGISRNSLIVSSRHQNTYKIKGVTNSATSIGKKVTQPSENLPGMNSVMTLVQMGDDNLPDLQDTYLPDFEPFTHIGYQ